jgi:2-(1,2-epoxy-1,2-dihydrophenyl)acetyl-CoA isomerase
MNFENILFEKIERVGRITLNRPEVKNALNVPILQDMTKAIEEVRKDDGIKVLIVTGAGDTFSGGGDVDFLINDLCKRPSPEIRNLLRENYGGAALSLRNLEKPVVGALNGPTVGAGFDLSLHFDLRIASEKAKFGSIWVRIGTIPALGGMFLLPRIVGLTKASEMMMTGEVIDAQEAYRIGLVNQVVPSEHLQERALEFANRLANGATWAVSVVKQGINRGLSGHLMGEVDWAVYMQSICLKTEDCIEGIKAFKERRKANFQGK